MDKEDIVDALLEDARNNDAHEAVVVDVPPEVLKDIGAKYAEEGKPRIATTLVAGPVSEEDEEEIALQTPSRVGASEDFSAEVRKSLRLDAVYGFRDSNLDGVPIPKENDGVVVHRP